MFYILNYKRNIKQFIRLFANIYPYKVDNIISLISTLCMSSKNKMFMFDFPSLILKNVKT